MTAADSRPAFVAVDWGTSSFRAALVAGDGSVIDRVVAAAGILKVEDRDFAAELRRQTGPWLDGHGALPMLLSGMIGSRNGWIEVPHRPCPAGLADLAKGCLHRHEAGFDLIFVPGLSHRDEDGTPDVMRGEEVQVFGALEAGADADVVLPGTHSKWVSLRAGRIVAFRTYMTGELFAAVRDHTIIGQLAEGDAHDPEAFAAGVRRGADDPALSHALFTARTLRLAGGMAAGAVAPYLSGILIGAEIAAAATEAATTRIVVGDDRLTGLYRTAGALLGVDLAAGPADAAVRGLTALAITLDLARP